jgi:hypothetical protein
MHISDNVAHLKHVLLTIVVKSALINKMENGYVTAAAS